MDDRYERLDDSRPKAATPSVVDTPGSSAASLRARYGIRPSRLIVMFTSLSFFIYFDRGVYGAVLEDMEDKFGLSNLQAGICSSAYLVCYCVASPVCAQLAKHFAPLRLACIGMLVWVAAVVLSGLALDFWTLLGARALTGIGEASFLVIAAPFIDFFAPPERRSTWLSMFYAAIPIGYAAGAVVGGGILGLGLLGREWDWRSAYFLEGILVTPCLVAFNTVRGPKSMLEISDKPEVESGLRGVLADVRLLLGNGLYMLVVLGYATQTFFVGAVALFGINYLKKEFDLGAASSGAIFGAITAGTGLVGSALGGIILDRTRPRALDASVSELEVAAHKVMVACSVVAAPAAMIGFWMSNLYLFLPFLFIGELAAFMMIGPINNATIWCVPVYLQPTALAMSTLAIHLLGDALSPVVIGALSDSYGMRVALFCSASMLLLPIVFFGAGLVVSHRVKGPEQILLE